MADDGGKVVKNSTNSKILNALSILLNTILYINLLKNYILNKVKAIN